MRGIKHDFTERRAAAIDREPDGPADRGAVRPPDSGRSGRADPLRLSVLAVLVYSAARVGAVAKLRVKNLVHDGS